MPLRTTPINANTPPDQQIAIINKNFTELDQNYFRIAYTGTVTAPSITNNTIWNTAVDTGIKASTLPAYQAYLYDGSSITQVPLFSVTPGSSPLTYISYVTTVTIVSNTVRFNFAIFNYSGSTIGTTSIRYYILRETAQ